MSAYDVMVISCSLCAAREPVKVDVIETLQGLPTIRAFRRQEHFKECFDSHLNLLNWARFLGLCVCSRLLIVCVFVVVFFVSVVVYVSITLSGSECIVFAHGLFSFCIFFFIGVFYSALSLFEP
jgi:ABC-type multidrug transport system fused ATPase/permease subunit